MAGKELVKPHHIERTIDLMLDGLSMKAVAAALGFTPAVLFGAIKRDPTAAQLYEHARELQADMEADEIKEIADTELDANRARVRVDVRKWRASKLYARRYGDKLDVNLTQTVDIRGALAEGLARAARVRPLRDQSHIIDAEVIDRKGDSAPSAADSESAVHSPAPTKEDLFS